MKFYKQALAVAMMSAFATSSFAAIDLDNGTDDALIVASELIIDATDNSGAGTSVLNGGTNLNITTKLGFGMPISTTYYAPIPSPNTQQISIF